eukprot:324752_1
MTDDADETTKLTVDQKQPDEPKPAYAALSGAQKSLSAGTAEEYITFDFLVTLSEAILSSDNHLANAIKESVDCEVEQIRDLTITEIDDGSKNKTSRVKGKIHTDDWELPMLQKKFQSIISDRVLSGNLQSICELEDRPMIRRFFCKTSQQLQQNKKTKSQKENKDLGPLTVSNSLRTEKDDSKKPHKTLTTPKSKLHEAGGDRESSPLQSKNENDDHNKDGKKERTKTTIGGDQTDDECGCFCVLQ